MSIEARGELAMILPLPAQVPAGEAGVQFIDLKEYPEFFSDMEHGFPVPVTQDHSSHFGPVPASAAARPLPVLAVGSFEASFVPAVSDFSRLDERFRLDPGVWQKLPGYEDYSFAVFKLKSGAMTVHPMAFSFPRRDPQKLFFPTVHIHDGKVHQSAEFDHVLYCQPRADEHLAVRKWAESYSHPANFMRVNKAKGIVLRDQHCYKREMKGRLPNRDTWLAVEA